MAVKMRESVGGAFESRGKFFMRVTTASQTRTPKLLPWCKSLGDAIERARKVQTQVNRLRAVGVDEYVVAIVEKAATATDMTAVVRAVDGITGSLTGHQVEVVAAAASGRADTFKKIAER